MDFVVGLVAGQFTWGRGAVIGAKVERVGPRWHLTDAFHVDPQFVGDLPDSR